jgi:phosphatidylglycerophosphate synthase/uncharacterized membrane protein YbhN (UPF0104 family)
MNGRTHRILTVGPLVVGISLLVVAFARTDIDALGRAATDLGSILPLVLLPSAGWHLLRTAAWWQCFPQQQRPSFWRAFRVRLAAEAFSYVTIRGVAGEPLKVLLLTREIGKDVSSSAVALERAAYTVVTIAIVGLGAATALLMLPLTPMWSRIFSVLAVAAALLVLMSVVLLASRARTRPTERFATSGVGRAVARFRLEFGRQLRDMVVGNRRRARRLLLLEVAAYGTMALEVWTALRLAGAPVSLTGAFALETFTRAASAASAFIPANLGALEISNAAAATAIHAAGGAAALALIRRVRGLFWCACGFLVYPRWTPKRFRPAADNGRFSAWPSDSQLLVLEAVTSNGSLSSVLGGLPIGERMMRAAARAQYRHLLVWTPAQREAWERLARQLGSRLGVTVTACDDTTNWKSAIAALDQDATVTMIGPAIVASPALLISARQRSGNVREPILEIPAGGDWPCSGVFRALPSALSDPHALVSAISTAERDMLPTGRDVSEGRALLALSASQPQLRDAEFELRQSIFKPTDGHVGRFNRRISIPVSVALIRGTRMNAHVMSILLVGLGAYAGWLFSRGDYINGVAGALVSLAASILDGCDGELARLQYKESAFGCWVDTFGDYAYYVFIFAGMTVGAVHQTRMDVFWWYGAALFVGLFLSFALMILLRDSITEGRPEQLRSRTKAHFYATRKRWARFAVRLSTCTTRATMPYGIVAFAVVGALPGLLVLAAVTAQLYWISLAKEFKGLLRSHGSPACETAKPA